MDVTFSAVKKEVRLSEDAAVPESCRPTDPAIEPATSEDGNKTTELSSADNDDDASYASNLSLWQTIPTGSRSA